MSWFSKKTLTVPTSTEALPGRSERMPVPAAHTVLGHPLTGPFPDGIELAQFGMGCFWAPRSSSGKCLASTPPRSAMPAGRRRIQRIARSAAG